MSGEYVFLGTGTGHKNCSHAVQAGSPSCQAGLSSQAQPQVLQFDRQQVGLQTSGTRKKCDTPCTFIYRDTLWS